MDIIPCLRLRTQNSRSQHIEMRTYTKLDRGKFDLRRKKKVVDDRPFGEITHLILVALHADREGRIRCKEGTKKVDPTAVENLDAIAKTVSNGRGRFACHV